ncbi:hypothetical protein D9758_005028 [Tetrapyrgos nigripes]|uniref:Uncharacterized protein n=1 Tax=Tetrapyrgos nigripes TaxID=182062 RepID=A0A8H5GWA1_9AGAR|nr:hypothetical protein D9758_005028 [Tetrapyrgos nigripes]
MEDPQRPSQSASSSTSLTDTLFDDQDESVRIAVRALDDMRNNAHANGKTSSITTPALSVASLSSVESSSLASPALSTNETLLSHSSSEPVFFRRVSHLPLVNGAISMYEHGKASSRVVKYGAEIMESGVKTISRPVIDRLPVNTVEHLDEFACRQLDKVSRFTSISIPFPVSWYHYLGLLSPANDIRLAISGISIYDVVLMSTAVAFLFFQSSGSSLHILCGHLYFLLHTVHHKAQIIRKTRI